MQEHWMQLSGRWSWHVQLEQWRDTDWMKINIDGVFVEQSWQSVAVIGFVTHDEKKGEIFATWRAPFHRVPPHQKSKPLTCEEGIYLVALHIHATLLCRIAAG